MKLTENLETLFNLQSLVERIPIVANLNNLEVQKKNIKTIHMPSSRVSGKSKLYNPFQAENKPCAVYISRKVP